MLETRRVAIKLDMRGFFIKTDAHFPQSPDRSEPITQQLLLAAAEELLSANRYLAIAEKAIHRRYIYLRCLRF